MRPVKLLILTGLIAILALATAAAVPPVHTKAHQNATSDQSSNDSEPDTAPLERRWRDGIPPMTNDADWERYKCKGRKLLYQMQLTDGDVGRMLPVPQQSVQSPYHYGHLAPWGYTINSASPNYRNLETDNTWGVANFFRFLGISTKYEEEGGEWKGFSIKHFSKLKDENSVLYDPNNMEGYTDPYGQHRRSSGAYHVLAVLCRGFIMIQNTRGPRAAADQYFTNFPSFPDSEIPELKRLSDIMWIAWQYCPNPTQIHYFLSLAINNPATNSIVSRVMNGQTITPEPKQYPVESDEGLALLGSPNGASFAHFLIERKAQVGHKYINRVWVWESESAHKMPCLMFGVLPVDVPATLPEGTNKARAIDEALSRENHHNQDVFIREHVVRMDGNSTEG